MNHIHLRVKTTYAADTRLFIVYAILQRGSCDKVPMMQQDQL